MASGNRHKAPSNWADRGIALLGSVLIHGVIVAGLVFGMSSTPELVEIRMPPTITATVVDRTAIVERQQAEVDRQNEIRREAARERRAQQQQEQLRQQQAEAQQRKQREAIEQRKQAEQAQADRQARAEADKQKELEQLREQQRANDLRIEQLRRERELQEQEFEAQRLAELMADEQSSLDAEANLTLKTQWLGVMQNTIKQNWRKPYTARSGVQCQVRIDLIPGGEVISAQLVGSCPWDTATQQSLIDAVNRSSPLPYKGYESVFERTGSLYFKID